VPNTVARAVLFNDAAIAPLGSPCVDVLAAAKVDLKAGQILDGMGHYLTYGLCENSDVVSNQNLLPIGLAEGCRLKREIPQDQIITIDDVIFPEGRLCDLLRQEQTQHFFAPQRFSD
jgi:predicted homoserine dehydrogenase-like protein